MGGWEGGVACQAGPGHGLHPWLNQRDGRGQSAASSQGAGRMGWTHERMLGAPTESMKQHVSDHRMVCHASQGALAAAVLCLGRLELPIRVEEAVHAHSEIDRDARVL